MHTHEHITNSFDFSLERSVEVVFNRVFSAAVHRLGYSRPFVPVHVVQLEYLRLLVSSDWIFANSRVSVVMPPRVYGVVCECRTFRGTALLA